MHGGILPNIVELVMRDRGSRDSQTVASWVNDAASGPMSAMFELPVTTSVSVPTVDLRPPRLVRCSIATVGGILGTPALVGAFGTGSEVAGHAETYLAIAFLGTRHR